MPSLREVRGKIKSVRKTQQVTKAMKMIAAARVKKAQANLMGSRPYARRVEELVMGLAAGLDASDLACPAEFLPRQSAKDSILLIATSDKGLCGAYNMNLFKRAMGYLVERRNEGAKVHLFVIGKKGRDFFTRSGFPIAKEYVNFIRQPSFLQANILATDLLSLYRNDFKIGRVVCLFANFKNMIRQESKFFDLLPVPMPEAAAKHVLPGDYICEPQRSVILKQLFDRYVRTIMFKLILESFTSEQASRMNVMENATKNASDMIDGLTLLGNNVRQAGITREILEVISGADALA
ncbi:MAG: ATP synthase F1 subunit gamma [Elusimicrobiota bacterium]